MQPIRKQKMTRRNLFIAAGVFATAAMAGPRLGFAKKTASPSELKIYCAGPLFNDSEREMMSKIAKTLEHSGYSTYLPHRDGFEFAKLSPSLIAAGLSSEEAQQLLNKIIFNFDIYNLLECDATVFNMNGRVPDGGSIVEASVTWSCGHPLVIYKDDPRTLMLDIDNPMITGLADFKNVNVLEDIPKVLYSEIKNRTEPLARTLYPAKVSEIYYTGHKIAEIKEKYPDYIDLCRELLKIL